MDKYQATIAILVGVILFGIIDVYWEPWVIETWCREVFVCD